MGEFATICYGEWAGIKEGIISSKDFYDIAEEFRDKEFSPDYLIGFGIGLPQGRAIRDQLYDHPQGSTIQRKADLLGKVLDNYGMWKWVKCFEDIETFLKHQDQWDLLSIPEGFAQKSLSLIQENLIQRAIENLINYHFQNYHLQAWTITYDFLNELNAIRRAKMRQEIFEEESLKRRASLKTSIIHWIENHRSPKM